MPVWHVSAAYHSNTGPKQFLQMTKTQVFKGIDLGDRLLRGVGCNRIVFVTDPPRMAIHIQKALTPEEIAYLPEGWMQIPAVDERGPCRRLDIA